MMWIPRAVQEDVLTGLKLVATLARMGLVGEEALSIQSDRHVVKYGASRAGTEIDILSQGRLSVIVVVKDHWFEPSFSTEIGQLKEVVLFRIVGVKEIEE